jgi:hypothetical protein
MRKLYCFVDENGQDTGGRIFIVAVVILEGDRAALSALCEEFESTSRKGRLKWGKAQQVYRLNYLRLVFAQNAFQGKLCYCVFQGMKDYETATIQAIERALAVQQSGQPFAAHIYVDGLSKTKRQHYAVQLRRLGVHPRKVQGVMKDENNALIRLADAVAGFVRDVLDGDTGDPRTLFDEARNSGVLIEG